ALLKLSKTDGTWVFGADNTKLREATVLIANPSSMSSGYVAWWLGKIEGEHMQPLHQGPVDASSLPEVSSGGIPPGKKQASGRGWEQQASIDLITQDDTPLQLIYKSSNFGGLKALLNLAGDIAYGLQEDPRRVYPLIELGVDSYVHKEFGTVYTPLLNITGWLDSEGNVLADMAKIANKGGLI
ncbi:MAG: hypothetical protein ACRENW_04315, partial [Thermodesulfobacteriota bacterium]